MSQSAVLVRFSKIDGKLCEKDAVNISQASLNEELYQMIKDYYLCDTEIIESNSKDVYVQKVISINDDGEHIVQMIDEKIQYMFSKQLSKEEKNITLDVLTILLNFRKIYLLKQEQYKNDSDVVLILG